MTDLTALPHDLDEANLTCRAVIETPSGSVAKYDFKPEIGALELHTLLPEGMSFPMDFGFVPSTLAEDGDPLDILVLFDAPCIAGSAAEVRLIGVIEATQSSDEETVRNDRLVGVAKISRLYAKIETLDDLGEGYIANLKAFWVQYNALRGHDFDITGIGGPAEAVAAIRRCAVKGNGAQP